MKLAYVLALFAFGAAAAEEKAKPDEMTGKWEVVSASFDGKANASVKGRTLLFLDGAFTTFDGEVQGRTVAYKADAKAKPKQIDMERPDGAKAEGIYSIEKDELKICYAEPGGERPAKFESKEGEKRFLLVLKRVKEK